MLKIEYENVPRIYFQYFQFNITFQNILPIYNIKKIPLYFNSSIKYAKNNFLRSSQMFLAFRDEKLTHRL
jgi:hypothetical protein